MARDCASIVIGLTPSVCTMATNIWAVWSSVSNLDPCVLDEWRYEWSAEDGEVLWRADRGALYLPRHIVELGDKLFDMDITIRGTRALRFYNTRVRRLEFKPINPAPACSTSTSSCPLTLVLPLRK